MSDGDLSVNQASNAPEPDVVSVEEVSAAHAVAHGQPASGAASDVTPEPPAQPQPASPAPSAGATLRAAREAAGVELPALALALKVSVRKLEALEADRYEQLPDLVFARALASSVCRALKVPPDQVLTLLPQSQAPSLHSDDSGLNTPFRSPADVARLPLVDRLSRPMVLVALAVLLVAVILIFFPAGTVTKPLSGSSPAARTAQAADAEAAGPQATTEPAPSEATVREATLPTDSAGAAATVPAQIAPAAATAPPVAATPPVAIPASTNPAAASVSGTAAPATGSARTASAAGTITFATHGASWIEVVDGNGAIQLSRVINGEQVSASGVLPLKVTIGRADITVVTVQGKPFDLASIARQGVARFEVKE